MAGTPGSPPEAMISWRDLDIFTRVETTEEAWGLAQEWYNPKI